MMVSNVDKVKAEEIVASVAAARLCLFKQVAVKEGGDTSPSREGQCVECDMPGGCGEIGVEGTCHKGTTPPRHFGRLQAHPSRMSS